MSNVSLKVKIFDNKGTRVLQVAKSTLTIGSAAHCDVVLDHPSVSAEHTRAWLEGGRIWVQDLGGGQGTSLNDIRLPALKPMLVRDLDVLRLGECESTLGLEPNLVRAPVLNSKPSQPESAKRVNPAPAPARTKPVPTVAVAPSVAPATEPRPAVKESEQVKRRAEADALSRELAELRLHLQMASLEKNSNHELTQQLQNLKEEIKSSQEQKQKWSEGLRIAELEKQQLRKTLEAERSNDMQKLQVWKKNSVGELAKQVRVLSAGQVKRWATRPLSQDMIFEWEGELTSIFRRVLLGDHSSESSLPDLPPLPAFPVPMPVPQAVPSDTVTAIVTGATTASGNTKIRTLPRVEPVAEASEKEKDREPNPASYFKHALKGNWQSFAKASLVLLAAIVALWYASSLYKKGGQTAQSSIGAERGEVPNPPRRAPSRFEPKLTRKYRASYTENVLYLENYVAAEQNARFRSRWLAELGRVAVNDWKLDQGLLSSLSFKEQTLIQDLNRIRNGMTIEKEQEGINQMRVRETLFQRDLESFFKSRASVDRFLKFKRSFYIRNQAYLSKETI